MYLYGLFLFGNLSRTDKLLEVFTASVVKQLNYVIYIPHLDNCFMLLGFNLHCYHG